MVLGGAGSCRSRAAADWSYTCLGWPVREKLPSCGGHLRGGPAGLSGHVTSDWVRVSLDHLGVNPPSRGLRAPRPVILCPRSGNPAGAALRLCCSPVSQLLAPPAAAREPRPLPFPCWGCARASASRWCWCGRGPRCGGFAAGSSAGPGLEGEGGGREELGREWALRCGRVAPPLPRPWLRSRTEGGTCSDVPSRAVARGPTWPV